MTFSEHMHRARKARGMNQDQLAEAMNVSRATVSHWENGRHLPDIDTVKRLSELLQYDFIPPPPDEVKPETPEAALEYAADETSLLPEIPPRKKWRPRLPDTLMGFCAGALCCLLIMLFVVLPFSGSASLPAAGAVVTPMPPAERDTIEWYRQADIPQEGKAFITIGAGTDSVKAIRTTQYPSGVGWIYTVYLTEQSGIEFTLTEYSYTFFSLDGLVGSSFTYGAEDIVKWWGSRTVPARGQRCVGAGIPLQAIAGAGIVIKGVDANGNELAFHGFTNLSQEIA